MKPEEYINIKNLFPFKKLGYNNVHLIPYRNFIWDGNKIIGRSEDSDILTHEYHSPKLYVLKDGYSILDFVEENKMYNIVLPELQPKKRYVCAWVDKYKNSYY
jgi:hypothetical protein